MKKHLLRLLVIGLFCNSVFAQPAPIGQWKSQLPMTNVIACVEANDVIFAASGSALFSVNKKDGTIQTLSKVNGLSDVGISAIRYSDSTQSLIVVYTNSNIDIIQGNKIYNIPDIKNAQVTGSKNIHSVFCKNHYAYLASDMGIVVVDLIKRNIKDTYLISSVPAEAAVLDIVISNSTIYAATNTGIYLASTNNIFLNSFQSWSKLQFRVNKPFNLLTYYNGKLYANTPFGYDGDSLFSYDGTSFSYFSPTAQWQKRKLDVCYNKLVVTNRFSVEVYDSTLAKVLVLSPSYGSSKDMCAGIIDAKGDQWIADKSNGLIKAIKNTYWFQLYAPDSPYSEEVFNVIFNGNAIWYTTGGANSSWNNIYHRNGIASLINNKWVSYKQDNTLAIDTTFDPLTLAIDPNDGNHVFVSTLGFGVLEFRGGKCEKVYNQSNSSLQPVTGFTAKGYIRTCGIGFDNANNLWVANEHCKNPLSVKPNNGQWVSYTLKGINNTDYISYMLIDDYNQKWLLLPRGSSSGAAIVIFNENNTFDNLTDDYTDTMSLSLDYQGHREAALPQCITKDLDGNVWLGTDRGVAVIYAPGMLGPKINKPRAQQILIQQDGYTQYLLETDVVTSIAVDGANRKWFGTEKGGAFLFSPDGTKQLLHFNIENSPLPSNTINSIGINGTTGEVFFGTNKGIVSYHGTATTGGETPNNVHAYPNPVPKDYSGKIGITGIAANSSVKITDIAGNLVYENLAEGGTAVWDGNTQKGNRVESGVYLVFVSNNKGEQTAATKILFIK